MYIYTVTGDFKEKELVFRSITRMIVVMQEKMNMDWSRHPFVYHFSTLDENKMEYNGCTIVRNDSNELTELVKEFSEKLKLSEDDVQLNISYNKTMRERFMKSFLEDKVHDVVVLTCNKCDLQTYVANNTEEVKCIYCDNVIREKK